MNRLLLVWESLPLWWKTGLAAAGFVIGLLLAWSRYGVSLKRLRQLDQDHEKFVSRLETLQMTSPPDKAAGTHTDNTESGPLPQEPVAKPAETTVATASPAPAPDKTPPMRFGIVSPTPENAAESRPAPKTREPLSPGVEPPAEPKIEIPAHMKGETGVRLSSRLGWIFTEKPGRTDDLECISGVSPTCHRRLQELGVYRFSQIGAWRDSHVSSLLADNPDLASVPWSYWRNRFRLDDGELVVPSGFEGENIKVSPVLGVLYRSEPERKDDFTRIEGVDAQARNQLYEHGIFRFLQIGFLPDNGVQLMNRQRQFGTADWAFWRHYFEFTGGELRPPPDRPVDRAKWTPHGFQFDVPPEHQDSLRLLPGVTAQIEDSLRHLGICTCSQVAALTSANVKRLKNSDPVLEAFDLETAIAGLSKNVLSGNPNRPSYRWRSWYGANVPLSKIPDLSREQLDQLATAGIGSIQQFLQTTPDQWHRLAEAHPGLSKLNLAETRLEAARTLGGLPEGDYESPYHDFNRDDRASEDSQPGSCD